MAEPLTGVGASAHRAPLRPLRQARFRNLFLARTISIVGDRVLPVALAFAVLDLTGSPTALGVVLAAAQVPTVVFLLGGGVLADRMERRRVMVGTDVAQFATQAVLAGLLLSGRGQVWELVVLQVVRGTAVALFRPASSGIVPQTVAGDELQPANALLRIASSMGTVLGPVLAGPLVAFFGAGWAIAVDSASFLVSAVFTTRIGPLQARDRPRPGFLQELGGGWREVRQRTWILRSIALFSFFQLVALSTFVVLGPAVARTELGGALGWAGILAAFGLGSVAGAAVALRLRPARPLRTAFLGMLLWPPVLVALALSLPVVVVASLAFVSGTVMVMADTLWLTVLQTNVPEHVLSRVSSFDWLGSTVFFPVGLALAGPLAAAAGAGPTLLGAAVLFWLAVLALFAARAVREPGPIEPAS